MQLSFCRDASIAGSNSVVLLLLSGQVASHEIFGAIAPQVRAPCRCASRLCMSTISQEPASSISTTGNRQLLLLVGFDREMILVAVRSD